MMKKNFLKFVSSMLVMALFLSTLNLFPAAANSEMEVVTSVVETALEEEVEAIQDSLLPIKAGDWWKATQKDYFKWNEFHNAVQNHIVKEYQKNGMSKELYVQYNNGKKKGRIGKADLYLIEGNVAYLWEVKPASYSVDPKKTNGENQLKGYVNNAVSINNPYLTLKIGDARITKESFEYKMYTITYTYSENGLILYWFERRSNEPDYEPKPGEEPVPWYSTAKKSSTSEVGARGQEAQDELNNDDVQGDSGLEFDPSEIVPIILVSPVLISHAQIIATGLLTKHAPLAKTNTASAGITVSCKTFLEVAGSAAVVAFMTDPTKASAAEINEINSAYEDFMLFIESYFGNDYMNAFMEAVEGNDFQKIDELMMEIQKLSDDYAEAGKATPPRDPLIIDLGEEGIELTSIDGGVNFDLDNNGFAERTAWIGTEDGFLALDKNGNKSIDNGGELFGDQFVMLNGNVSSTGFEALSSYDDNKDKVINALDPVFGELFVWIDSDTNGKTDENELESLYDLGITEIDLCVTSNEKVDTVTGTMEAEYSIVTFKEGDKNRIGEFWFPIDSSNTTQGDVITAGNVPNISKAIALDESGQLLKLCLEFSISSDISTKRLITKQILYFITNSSDISINERGGNIDARDLHVIEQFMGTEFVGISGSSPNAPASTILKEIYTDIENYYYNVLNLYTGLGGYIQGIYEYECESGKTQLNLTFLYYIIDSKIIEGENVDALIYDLGVYLKSFDKLNGTDVFTDYSLHFSEISSHYSKIVELAKTGNTIVGTSDDDVFYGSSSNDFIFGEDGNDILFGENGNDLLYGGCGDDTLNGGDGDDSYFIEYNHGNDIIYDADGTNRIIFTNSSTCDDYAVSVDMNGLLLRNQETGDTICLSDFLTNPLNYEFYFNGESVLLGGGDSCNTLNGSDEDEYLEVGDGFNVFYGGGGNDTLAGGANMDFLYGEDGADTLLGRNGVNALFGGTGNDMIYDGDDGSYLNGGDEDDSLYGGGGADILDGGAGNDYLQADHGNDTYVFGKGYDTDTINASSDLNTVIIHGYRSTDMINTRNAHNDLIINFKNSDDCLIIDHFFDYNSNRDFNFVFDDGTVLGQYDITAKYAPIEGADDDEWLAIQNNDNGIIHGNGGNDGVSGGSGNDELYGDSGDDTLYGNDGNDILDGGTGTDGLNGGNGTDTYIFAKGYGNDTVNEWGSGHSVIKLSDIDSDEVTVTDQYGSNLLLSVVDTEDTLVISNFKWGQATYTFEFADGAVATVNKDIWTFEFSQPPVVPEEEISTSDNETTSFDTGSLETDTVDDQTENTSIQNSSESTVEKVYEETLSTEVSYEPEETVATTITESSTTESDTEVGTGQDEIHETVFTETISSDDSIASSETELSNDLDVN